MTDTRRSRRSPTVVVVGGANLDVLARSTARVVPATSNPGTATLTAGGVGRNVAENLARLGTRTHLVAAVGNDPLGDRLVTETSAAGVDVSEMARSTRPTGTYTAVLDVDGELVLAVADMGATDAIGPDDVRRVGEVVAAADLLILDGNLSIPTVLAALELAATSGVRVVLDPVSVPKAGRLAPVVASGHRWFAITPNLAELAALTRRPVDSEAELGAAIDVLHDQGVEHVWVRRGADGSVLSTAEGSRDSLSAIAGPVADVTGAGDAMLAAFCHGVLSGRTAIDAARLGHAAAALTIESHHTVRPDLSGELVEQLLSRRSNTP